MPMRAVSVRSNGCHLQRGYTFDVRGIDDLERLYVRCGRGPAYTSSSSHTTDSGPLVEDERLNKKIMLCGRSAKAVYKSYE